MSASSTDSTTAAPAWQRILLPSAADLIFLALLLSLCGAVLSQKMLGDAGTGWHIRTGEIIWKTHAIPRTDPFSSSLPGKTWYPWEWLYDAMIAVIHHWAGLNGVVLFTAAIIALAFALTFRWTLARGAGFGATLILLVLALGASSVHFLARPHVVSWLFTLLCLQLITCRSVAIRPRILLLVVLMIVWANLHAGFLTGLALMAIVWLSDTAMSFVQKDWASSGPWRNPAQGLGVAALVVAATLVNPFGYKLHLHIYQYLSNRFLMSHIEEFLSPNFHGLAQQCFAGLLLVTMLVIAFGRRKPSLQELLLILFAVASGLYATRSLPVSSILLTAIVAPLARLDEGKGVPISRLRLFSSRMEVIESRSRGHLWPAAALVLSIWIVMHGGRLGAAQVFNAQFSSKRMPVEAVQVIAQRQIHAPIFCPDSWGGYVIYRLYPENKVVVDDRHDFYGEQFLKSYLSLVHGTPDWERFLSDNEVEWALLPSGSTPANLLKETTAWKVEYADQTAVLLHRAR